MMTETPLRYRVMLGAIPLVLVASIVISLLWFVNREEEKSVALTGEVSVESIEDNLVKLTEYVGPRDFGTAEGRDNIRKVMAMVDGVLGEENIGYEVHRNRGEEAHGRLWPCFWVDRGEGEEVLMLAVRLDDFGAGISLALALAEREGRVSDRKKLRIVFYPPILENELVWSRVEGEGETLGRKTFLGHNGLVGSLDLSPVFEGFALDISELHTPRKIAEGLKGFLPEVAGWLGLEDEG